MKNQNNTYKQQLNTAGVTPSAFGYRFSVISNRNGETLGTGFFKSSRKMTEDERLRFFHQYTHGKYQKEGDFVSIDIFEAEV